MRKDYLLGILFFSALWGASESALGGFLYKAHVPNASVPLTIIAFIILTIAKIYLPQKGSATFISTIAMLYKFLNTPFFACHLLAIFLLGLSYDLVFHFSKIKNRAIFGLVTTYLGYILFALIITYVFRYHYWINEGLSRILRYVGMSGTLAAFANFFAVPLSFKFGQVLKKGMVNPFEFKSRLATSSVSLITLSLWFLAIVRWF
ncbi:MAG: hypothetical protein ISS45_06460 [Candidatus Omnitrophica bacterium]|nr:hypothetical protein [Candidatus Omnitrophota bacterium]